MPSHLTKLLEHAVSMSLFENFLQILAYPWFDSLSIRQTVMAAWSNEQLGLITQ